MEAAKLYREGYAPKVWLTYSTEPGATLEAMGIPFAGEEYYDSLVLMHEGVPADAIRVLQPPIVNTADEIAAASASMQKGTTIIIVTSKVQHGACEFSGTVWPPAVDERSSGPPQMTPSNLETGGALLAMRWMSFANAWES